MYNIKQKREEKKYLRLRVRGRHCTSIQIGIPGETPDPDGVAAMSALLYSELHFMYSIVFGERETSVQVLSQEWGLVLLDVLNELFVHGGLELCTVGGYFLLLSTFLKESSASGALLVGSEGLVVDSIELDTGDAHLGRGGDGVNLVDASEGHSVHLAWAAHQEQTGLQLLEEDDSLSAESA